MSSAEPEQTSLERLEELIARFEQAAQSPAPKREEWWRSILLPAVIGALFAVAGNMLLDWRDQALLKERIATMQHAHNRLEDKVDSHLSHHMQRGAAATAASNGVPVLDLSDAPSATPPWLSAMGRAP